MRIAHVLRKYDPSEWGGVETAVLQLMHGLRAAGVDNTVYAPKLAQPTQVADPFAAAGFAVRRYRATLPVLGITADERQRRLAVGGNILSLDLPARLLMDGVDVLHAHTLNRIGGAVRVVSKVRNVPYAVSIHGGYLDLPPSVVSEMVAQGRRGFDWGKPFGLALGSRRVVDDAAAVFAVNPREAELLQEKYPHLNVECMPLSIDPKPFAQSHVETANRALAITPERKVILCVCRIHPVKNQLLLIEAVDRLRREFPDLLLVLVGGVTDASYSDALRQTVAERGLENHVRILDPLPPGQPTLVGLYQRADLFALASDAETFGLVLIEATLARTPFVASDTSGATHVAGVCESGQLFRRGDVDDFVRVARERLANPIDSGVLDRAHQTVIDKFSVRAVAERYLVHYRRLTSGNAA